MIQAVLLFTLFFGAATDGPADDTTYIFTGIAADGTVHFGDRPSAVAPPGSRPASRLSLPPGNILAPVAAAGDDHPPRAPAPGLTRGKAAAAEAPDAAPPDPEVCQRMRTRLASLWQERRQGYAPARGQELKRDIRRLQRTMKARCGNWR